MTEAKSGRPGPRTIRNLRRTPVHLRLSGQGEKPYRVQLEPRGNPGDTAEIPLACQQSTAYTKGVGVLFEIITKAELRKLEYGPTGYQPGPQVEVYSDKANTLSTITVDEKGRRTVVDTSVGPRVVTSREAKEKGLAGADTGLGDAFEAKVRAAENNEVDVPDLGTVKIERRRGQ